MNKRIRKKWKCRNNFRHYSTYNELFQRSAWNFVKYVILHNDKMRIMLNPRYRQLNKIYQTRRYEPVLCHIDLAQNPDVTVQQDPLAQYQSAGLGGLYGKYH
jgi:hypothetical protein